MMIMDFDSLCPSAVELLPRLAFGDFSKTLGETGVLRGWLMTWSSLVWIPSLWIFCLCLFRPELLKRLSSMFFCAVTLIRLPSYLVASHPLTFWVTTGVAGFVDFAGAPQVLYNEDDHAAEMAWIHKVVKQQNYLLYSKIELLQRRGFVCA
jgi:hypothetical protein